MEFMRKSFSRPSYWSKRIALLVLCHIHTLTRYKVARNVRDLFYWPEGMCPDVVVVISFFLLMIWCVKDDLEIALHMLTEGTRGE